MVKSDSMCSDIDLIKEIEGLRLKQKLLVESLKKESLLKKDEAFVEINSKLDFLVKIFKDAQDTEQKDEEIGKILEKVTSISDKILKVDELDAKLVAIVEKFDKFGSELDKLKSQVSAAIPPSPGFVASPELVSSMPKSSSSEASVVGTEVEKKELLPPVSAVPKQKKGFFG